MSRSYYKRDRKISRLLNVVQNLMQIFQLTEIHFIVIFLTFLLFTTHAVCLRTLHYQHIIFEVKITICHQQQIILVQICLN